MSNHTRTPFALAAAAVLLAACAGEKSGDGMAESASAMAATTPPVITITAKDFAFEAPDTVSAGMVTIRLVNQGPELHHVQLVHLADGKTTADFDQALKAMKPTDALPIWAHEVAGPNAPVPGSEHSITEQLEAGNYAIVCFIPGADQIPHVMKGMMRALTVLPSTTAAAPAPVADINIRMADYAWEIAPEFTAGNHMIKIENSAEQPHEMLLVMLAPGKTPSDLAKWVGNQVGPPPAKPLGGISGMAKGAVVYVPVDLVPGEYGLLCFLTDAKDGKMHVEHGMMKQFSVK